VGEWRHTHEFWANAGAPPKPFESFARLRGSLIVGDIARAFSNRGGALEPRCALESRWRARIAGAFSNRDGALESRVNGSTILSFES